VRAGRRRLGRPPQADTQDFVDACHSARISAASVKSLDTIAVNAYPDRPVPLRWILVHMVEEYARHTAPTLPLVQGVAPRSVMDVMGWSEQRTVAGHN